MTVSQDNAVTKESLRESDHFCLGGQTASQMFPFHLALRDQEAFPSRTGGWREGILGTHSSMRDLQGGTGRWQSWRCE
jgi:hypothetical protein